MGGGHSKMRRRPACRTKVRNCRDACRAIEAEEDYEKLEEFENAADTIGTGSVEEMEIVSLENTASHQTSESIITEDCQSHGSTFTIVCDNKVENFEKFLEQNLCTFNNPEGTDSARCKETKPHLHGYLNGIPIIVKLFDATEDDGKKADHNAYVSSSTITEGESSKGKNRPCDIQKDSNIISRQTSPMRKMHSANTSPCSVSKECLKSENYNFSEAKCSHGNECIEKCATHSEPVKLEEKKSSDTKRKRLTKRSKQRDDNSSQNSGDNVQDKKKRGTGSKKQRERTKNSKQRPWLTPPIPALKSEPVSDPSTVPNHIWYGGKAYAFVDEEPKPRSTFNSENTGSKKKKKTKSEAKTTINKNEEITSARLTVELKQSPFKRMKSESDNSVGIYSHEKDEPYPKKSEPPEYLTYSVLFAKNSAAPFLKYRKKSIHYDHPTCDVLLKGGISCIPPSKYQFLFSSAKESSEKTFLRSFYNSFDGISEANYIIAPVRVPKLFKNWQKKMKNFRTGSNDTDTDHTEQILIIARTPPLRSSKTLIMAAKTVITVRENAPFRLYSDNCGGEEEEEEDAMSGRSEVVPTLYGNKYESSKKSSEVSKRPEILRLPLLIISQESIRSSNAEFKSPSGSAIRRKKSKKSSKKSLKSGQPELPIFKFKFLHNKSKNTASKHQDIESSFENSSESFRPNKSFAISEKSNSIFENESRENLCSVSRPTRYCCRKTTPKKSDDKRSNFRHCFRISKTRTEERASNTSCAAVGLFDSIKKSYRERVRPFFTRKSKKVRKIFKKSNNSNDKPAKKEISGCVIISPRSFSETDFPIMENKVTCTSGSNDSSREIDPPKNWPSETAFAASATNTNRRSEVSGNKKSHHYNYHRDENVVARKNNTKSVHETSCKSYPQPCECPENPSKSIRAIEDNFLVVCGCPPGSACDGSVKKKGSVLSCCMKPVTSPTQTQTARPIDERKKQRNKFEKRKNRLDPEDIIKS